MNIVSGPSISLLTILKNSNKKMSRLSAIVSLIIFFGLLIAPIVILFLKG